MACTRHLAMLTTQLTAMVLAAAGACHATEAIPLKGGPWKRAVFAGGCFWCMEPPFDALAGVKATYAGYTGGRETHPSYDDVANRRTGHVEAILVAYDPKVVSYAQLLEVFWHNINPTQDDGQFVDIGPQYRSAIFFTDEDERRQAEASKLALGKSGKFSQPIVTEIRKAGVFWGAETYHQDFYKKNPTRYHEYRSGSGRDAFIQQIWGDGRDGR